MSFESRVAAAVIHNAWKDLSIQHFRKQNATKDLASAIRFFLWPDDNLQHFAELAGVDIEVVRERVHRELRAQGHSERAERIIRERQKLQDDMEAMLCT